MKISYYELLGMVKEGNAPERIEVSLTSGTTEIYKAEYDAGEFNYYLLQRDLQNENYRFYLSECFLESSMFDKCIIILDEEDEFEDIEEITCEGKKIELGSLNKWLTSTMNDNECKMCSAIECLGMELNRVIKNQKKIIERLKEMK